MKKLIIVMMLVMLLLVPVSCINSTVLDGTRWSLIEINGSEIIEGTHISLYFDDGTATGSAGCNSYYGDYSTKNPNILKIQVPGRTDMDCPSPEGVIEQEKVYLSTLPRAATYEIDNDNLEIYSEDKRKLLVFERKQKFQMNPDKLIGTSWQLVSMNGAPILEGLSILLTFESGSRATGRAGVFNYVLDYTASGDSIRWGMGSHRLRELPQLPRELEHQALEYTDAIARASHYNLTEDRLEIFTSRGDSFVYKPFGDS